MAKNETIEILVPELTLHQQVTELRDNQGNVIGRQNGLGKTYFQGEKVAASDVSPDYLEALDNEDHPSHEAVSKRIKRSTGNPEEDAAIRLGLPFAGYDEMDEDDIVALLPNLPSATQQRIKDWERKNDEPRQRIVQYSTGFGESPIARQSGEVNSGTNEEVADKDVRELTTREVPEGEPVQGGEGYTGTGEPQKAYGSEGDASEGDPKGSGKQQRRGRRDRQARPKRGVSKAEGGSSAASENQ